MLFVVLAVLAAEPPSAPTVRMHLDERGATLGGVGPVEIPTSPAPIPELQAALIAAMKPTTVFVDVGRGARYAMLRPILVTAARADARVLLVETDAAFTEAVEIATTEPHTHCVDCGARVPEWLQEPPCEAFVVHLDGDQLLLTLGHKRAACAIALDVHDFDASGAAFTRERTKSTAACNPATIGVADDVDVASVIRIARSLTAHGSKRPWLVPSRGDAKNVPPCAATTH